MTAQIFDLLSVECIYISIIDTLIHIHEQLESKLNTGAWCEVTLSFCPFSIISYLCWSYFINRCMLLGHYVRGLEYRLELMQLMTISSGVGPSSQNQSLWKCLNSHPVLFPHPVSLFQCLPLLGSHFRKYMALTQASSKHVWFFEQGELEFCK